MQSRACKYEDFKQGWYLERELDLHIRALFPNHAARKVDYVNRKFWEWCLIAEALDQYGKLSKGCSGIGFAVGREPLASYFLGKGCTVLATDLHPDRSTGDWLSTGQHSKQKDDLFFTSLATRHQFEENLGFQYADMRDITDLVGEYDFLWSSCAMEHLGGLAEGENFVKESLKLLKPGGIAVHTTEINVLSNDATLDTETDCIYRKQDLLRIGEELRSLGYDVPEFEFDFGSTAIDQLVDTPPYMQDGAYHLKLEFCGFVTTSYFLLIMRPPTSAPPSKAQFWKRFIGKFGS